jgi:hypothetical protein
MTAAFPLILATSGAKSIPILGDIDNKFWIFVAIAIGSIIVEWLKKKKPPGETGSTDEAEPHRSTTSTPSRPAASQPAATSGWEEELRRLLGGEPPVARPPPVHTPQPTPVPPPIRPVVIQAPRPVLVPSPVTGAPPVVRSIPPPLAETAKAEARKSVEIQLPTLKGPITAYQRASHLQGHVIERSKHVDEMTERQLASVPTARHTSVSPDAVRSIALIRNRNTVRQAIVASLIFGAPKGLENE